jgi:hypothetical protein
MTLPPRLILPSILKQPGYPVVPTAAAILLAAQLFCQAAKMAVHAGAADCRNMMSPDNALARAILLASAMAATLVGLRSFPNGSRRLPACQTILNAIGNLLAGGCQVEEFLFADIFRFFGKLPINRRLAPEIIIPIHACHCALALLMAKAIRDKIRP